MNSNDVISIFETITKIPRESGHEEKITQFLLDFAAERGLSAKKDATGNVVIRKEASSGKEKVPTLVLQAHQDMVCEKLAGFDFDFSKDPIQYIIKDGWMIAPNTTLGADDGIGIAACLALLQSDLPTGPIECLFTISEETGMDGAMALEEGFFEGKTLINLDSEDEGELFVGCAGGVNTTAEFKYAQVPVPEGFTTVQLKLFGGIGGHSGDDINKERANAVKLLARFIYAQTARICAEGGKLLLVSFSGGNKYNAISRDCEAVIAVPRCFEGSLAEAFYNYVKSDLGKEFSKSDPGLSCSSSVIENASFCIDEDCAQRLISSLIAVHHGVEAMSQDIPGLVETSTNLAFVKLTAGNTIVVGTSQRSSTESAKDALADSVAACFTLAGASVVHSDPYPGWKPNMESEILMQSVASYRKLFSIEPKVKAIHAGLECGLFLEKFPELDMISFGPTLRGVHAPGEKLDLESNERFVKLLEDIVTNFK